MPNQTPVLLSHARQKRYVHPRVLQMPQYRAASLPRSTAKNSSRPGLLQHSYPNNSPTAAKTPKLRSRPVDAQVCSGRFRSCRAVSHPKEYATKRRLENITIVKESFLIATSHRKLCGRRSWPPSRCRPPLPWSIWRRTPHEGRSRRTLYSREIYIRHLRLVECSSRGARGGWCEALP
jgi:hypothetical protein